MDHAPAFLQAAPPAAAGQAAEIRYPRRNPSLGVGIVHLHQSQRSLLLLPNTQHSC